MWVGEFGLFELEFLGDAVHVVDEEGNSLSFLGDIYLFPSFGCECSASPDRQSQTGIIPTGQHQSIQQLVHRIPIVSPQPG